VRAPISSSGAPGGLGGLPDRDVNADAGSVARRRTRAGQSVTSHVGDTTITIGFGDGDTRTVTRITSKPVRGFKAQQHRKAAHVS